VNDAVFATEALAAGVWPVDASVFRAPFDVTLFIRLDDRLASDDEWFSFRNLLNNARETAIYFWRAPSGSSGSMPFENEWSGPPDWVGGRSGIVCLTGATGTWALCIDNRAGVGVLGLARTVASTQRVIFQNMWISAADAAIALGDQSASFSARYAPSPWFTTPSPENPLWRKWCFVCHVEDENDKLFYWPQFERFFGAIDLLIADWPFRRMLPSQGLWRRVGRDDALRLTGTEAPVGGWQGFTHANCHKVATKFLTNNRHLQLRFDGHDDEAAALYPRRAPGLIDVSFFWLRAARTSRRSPEGSAEMYFVLPGTGRSRADACNQYFEFFVLDDAVEATELERVVDELADVGKATAVYETARPNQFYELDQHGAGQISSISSCGPESSAPDGTPQFVTSTWQPRTTTR
jgi:hypothetical protein